jgi:ribose transport system substrate-binding protein
MARRSLALVLLALLGLTACTQGETPGTGPNSTAGPGKQADARLELCVIHNLADHPSIQSIITGMKESARHYPVDLQFFDPAGDPQKQSAQIDDCIARKFDAILLNAVDPAAVVPGIKKAHDAGIPVVMHNADTNAEGRQYTATFVTPDLRAQGVAVGRLMAEQLPQGAKIVIISGVPGQSGVKDRTEGAEESFGAKGLTVLDNQAANWDKDKALQVMQAFLTRYPQIDAVYALDDFMALGALQAIKAANRQDKIKVYGVGGAKEACTALENGELAGSAIHLSYLVGVQSVRAAWDVVHGLPVPKDITFPSIGIDAKNVKQNESLCW